MRRCLKYRVSEEGDAAWHAARGTAVDYALGLLQPDHDLAFHHAVALASGNRLFSSTRT